MESEEPAVVEHRFPALCRPERAQHAESALSAWREHTPRVVNMALKEKSLFRSSLRVAPAAAGAGIRVENCAEQKQKALCQSGERAAARNRNKKPSVKVESVCRVGVEITSSVMPCHKAILRVKSTKAATQKRSLSPCEAIHLLKH